jgi:hypothetical protein
MKIEVIFSLHRQTHFDIWSIHPMPIHMIKKKYCYDAALMLTWHFYGFQRRPGVPCRPPPPPPAAAALLNPARCCAALAGFNI